MAYQSETILPATSQKETADLVQFLDELTPTEQREMLIFMQGIKFAKGADTRNAPAPA